MQTGHFMKIVLFIKFRLKIFHLYMSVWKDIPSSYYSLTFEVWLPKFNDALKYKKQM